MASNSPPQYRCNLIEGIGKVEGYQRGGFCPIILGQILEEKYEIIAKLGYGGHSTVWLAKELSITYDSVQHIEGGDLMGPEFCCGFGEYPHPNDNSMIDTKDSSTPRQQCR
jgi:hypothetical protein